MVELFYVREVTAQYSLANFLDVLVFFKKHIGPNYTFSDAHRILINVIDLISVLYVVVSFWFREVLSIILIIFPFVREESQFLQAVFHTHSGTMYHIRVYHWHAFYESEISALIIWPKVVTPSTSTCVTLSGLITLTSPFPYPNCLTCSLFWFCGRVRIMERTKIWVY